MLAFTIESIQFGKNVENNYIFKSNLTKYQYLCYFKIAIIQSIAFIIKWKR